MNITTCRLSELDDHQLVAVSALLRREIIGQASDWVCQARQRPHFWGEDTVKDIAAQDSDAHKTITTVALVDHLPVGLCFVMVETDPVQLLLFIVSTAYSEKEQFAIADAIALAGCAALPQRAQICGWFPAHGFAADYATRCGFTSQHVGTDMAVIPDANPILLWAMPIADMVRNIEAYK